jgi:hypothetical protein
VKFLKKISIQFLLYVFISVFAFLVVLPAILIFSGFEFKTSFSLFLFLILSLLIGFTNISILGNEINEYLSKKIGNKRKLYLIEFFINSYLFSLSLGFVDMMMKSVDINNFGQFKFSIVLLSIILLFKSNKTTKEITPEPTLKTVDSKEEKIIRTRTNDENELTITIEWLEKEIEEHHEPYLVIQGFYDTWDTKKEEKSPNLEVILNYMYQKGYNLVSIQPMGNPNCKEMVFLQS